MRESGAEVSTVEVRLFAGSGVVKLLASWAVYIDAVVAGDVRQANWQNRLSLTVYTRAAAEVHILELFVLCRENTNSAHKRRCEAPQQSHVLTMACIPRPVRIKRAWIRPYNTSAAVSTISCCSSGSCSVSVGEWDLS